MNKNERAAIDEEALKWFDDLDSRALHDLAVSAAIQRRTHHHLNGDPRVTLEHLKLVIRQGVPPVPAGAPADEGLRAHAALIAGLAMRILEDIYARRDPEPMCDCPACQLRALLEGMVEGGAEVVVVDGTTGVQELHDFLRSPTEPKKH